MRRRWCLLVGVLVLEGVLAGCHPGRREEATLPGKPEIRLLPDPAGARRHVFVVAGLEEGLVAALAREGLDARTGPAVFPVRVAGSTRGGDELPTMAGTYRLDGGVLRFEPRFPLEPGLRYRAAFHPSRALSLLASRGEPATVATTGDSIEEEFLVPPRPRVSTTVVRAVYPTADLLPENQLKFYLHFSAPMSRGQAYDHVHLLDDAGEEIALPFLELDEELWDAEDVRFTLFFDPGRIKRGVRPFEEIGPALEAGKSYTLVIDRHWEDATGNLLKEEFRKSFRVGPPDRESPDPENWKLQVPQAGTRDPLRVSFPEPLDHALLHRLLWIRDAAGRPVRGEVEVPPGERAWSLKPAAPWQSGPHELVAQTILEDLAGNQIGRPFEVDVVGEVRRELRVETASVPFRIEPRE